LACSASTSDFSFSAAGVAVGEAVLLIGGLIFAG
jgi:hypothetical protein